MIERAAGKAEALAAFLGMIGTYLQLRDSAVFFANLCLIVGAAGSALWLWRNILGPLAASAPNTPLQRFRSLVPIQEAARNVYEALRAMRKEHDRNTSEHAVRSLGGRDPQSVLDWCANTIIQDSGLQILGRKPPSSRWEEVPLADRELLIYGNGALPVDPSGWTDLQVGRLGLWWKRAVIARQAGMLDHFR